MEIGPIAKSLDVTGPRQWLPQVQSGLWPLRRELRVTGWTLSRPAPIDRVEMDWRHSFGGRPAFVSGAKPDERNPLGCGRLGPAEGWHDKPQPAPQIYTTTLTPDDDNTPAGLLSSLPDVDWLLGDRGYDADWFREALKDRDIRACIPGRKQ